MNLFKKYISVKSICKPSGELVPVSILWSNNREYKIDKIYEVRKAASSVGGCGILYECLIGGKRKKLYYEINRWFIESTRP